jgi:hypothetical protein
VLELRALDRSVKEIADALGAEGTPISHQSVWVILSSEGLSACRPGHGVAMGQPRAPRRCEPPPWRCGRRA